MTGCAILILAAGASSRMRGGDKLLEVVAGQPLLRLMALRAIGAGKERVFCTLPGPTHQRSACLDGLAVTPVLVADPSEGMGASIRAGVAALPEDCPAVMILPADMPEITADDLTTILLAHQSAPAAILRAVDHDGTPGHPVIFPADLFPALGACQGDTGARDVLRGHPDRVILVPLPDRHATTDLDTPEDWAAWRACGERKNRFEE